MQALNKRKPRTTLAVLLAVTAGLLAVSATSAFANHLPYTDGNGAYTAVATLNPPPQMCATYRTYNAQLVFPNNKVVNVSSTTDPTSSLFQWGEFWDGTYKPQTSATGLTSCKPGNGPGAVETGFTGTHQSGSATCKLGQGTYQRGNLGAASSFQELNIQFVFSGTFSGNGCPASPLTVKTTIKSVPDPTDPTGYISLCSTPIAPSSCQLGPAVHSGTW